MDSEQIEKLLNDALDLTEVLVKTDGSHATITVVGEAFEGLSRVKQQQLVYRPLNEHIASGAIHAVSIKAYTPTQWQREKKLQMLS
ncbi:MAG: BolA family protein [Idiomarina sp.]